MSEKKTFEDLDKLVKHGSLSADYALGYKEGYERGKGEKPGAVWVKASERLPLHKAFWNIEDGFKKDCSFPIRIDGKQYGMADIFDNRKEGAPDAIYYFVIKGEAFCPEHFEDEFHRFEWLDDSLSNLR